MPDSKPTIITNTQHVFDLIQLCAQKNVRHAVVCPGSRCAPLLIACHQHPDIKTISVTDERSAAFIALGIAQQTRQAVILICTSGTAGQNFAPAVTEAFYQHIPLFVFTADRPAEWIDQWDGQTIHQHDLYGDHVKTSITYVAGKASLQQADRVLNRSITDAPAPVHLNIPIDKPFYPLSKAQMPRFRILSPTPPTQKTWQFTDQQWSRYQNQLNQSRKVLIHYGQYSQNKKLESLLMQLGIPMIGDIISNLSRPERTDLFYNTDDDGLRPDLLITLGCSVISEKHKAYFRRHKPTFHWHIGMGRVGDPFQTQPEVISTSPITFFKAWVTDKRLVHQPQTGYQQYLNQRSKQVLSQLNHYLSQPSFNQYSSTSLIFNHLPDHSVLHLANSMTVRVANAIGLPPGKAGTMSVHSNRGTSGIDGCLSTAMGQALTNPEQIHTLIIGDLAFFYDRNGLWLNHPLPDNLKIIVMNNAGGGIFKLIPGPFEQGKAYKLFNTPHQRTAKLSAQEFKLGYQSARSLTELEVCLKWLFKADSKTAILEIFTDMEANEQAFSALLAQSPPNKPNQ